MGESKFWVLRKYRREPFMKREHILGELKTELCFRSEVRVAQRPKGGKMYYR